MSFKIGDKVIFISKSYNEGMSPHWGVPELGEILTVDALHSYGQQNFVRVHFDGSRNKGIALGNNCTWINVAAAQKYKKGRNLPDWF